MPGHYKSKPAKKSFTKKKRLSDKVDLSPAKAKKILRHGEVHGHPLTKAQKGLFGAVAGKGKKK